VGAKQHRLVVEGGRVVIAERWRTDPGENDAWFVWMEDDPDNCSCGGFDGHVVAELLGYGSNPAAYPEVFDEWRKR